MDCSLPGSSVYRISQARNWSMLPFPSRGILLTQESNSSLLLCRWIPYYLGSHESTCIFLSESFSWPPNRADPKIPMTFSASPFFVSFLVVITIVHCISFVFASLSIFSIRVCPPLGQGPSSLADHRIHRVQQHSAHRFCPFPCSGVSLEGGEKHMMNRLYLLSL